VVAALAVIAAACSSSGKQTTGNTAPPVASPTTVASTLPRLTVLVTNDDGYAAPGIDTMVQALVKLPSVVVTVVAPLENQSGTGTKSTDGVVKATHVKTASGYPAIAVAGYPSDAVNYALNTVYSVAPDLVVSGINNGQNLGPFIAVSGTIGAAETASLTGVPAIAVSQGFGNPPDFAAAARLTTAWITEHRSQYILAHPGKAQVISINVPTCVTGTVRGVMQLPPASGLNGRNINKVNCNSTAVSPRDDIDAFADGFAVLTDLDVPSGKAP
jgi:5'-nucleotidase